MLALRNIGKLFKSAVAILLCCLLIFVCSYRRPVKAEAAATTCVVAGCVLVATALAALGIGCSAALPTPQYNAACQHIANGISESVMAQVKAVQFSATAVKAQLTQDFLHAVFKGVSTEYPQVLSYSSFEDMGKALNIYPFFIQYWCETNASNMTNVTQLDRTFNCPVDDKSVETLLYMKNLQVDIIPWSMYDEWRIKSVNPTVSYKSVHVPIVYVGGSACQCLQAKAELSEIFYKTIDDSVNHILVTPVASDGSEKNTTSIRIDGVPDLYNTSDTVYNPANDDLYADGYSVLNHPAQDVIDKVAEQQGNPDKVINVTIPDAVAKGSSVTDATKAQTQASTTGLDLTDTAEREKNATANKGRTIVPPKNPSIPDLSLPTQITRKFPFCLPFDFVNSVKMLKAPAKPPSFTLPLFVVKEYNWNFSITLNWEDFDKKGILGGICRWGFSVLWIIGLIFVTKKLIWK